MAAAALFVVLAIDGCSGARYWQTPVEAPLNAVPVGNVHRSDWRPAVLPREWVTEGNPDTRAVPLMTVAVRQFYAGL